MGLGKLTDFIGGFACFIFCVLSCWCFRSASQTVGIVPPSITNSLPVMAEALSDARKATSSATSSGLFGPPKRNSAKHVHQLLPGRLIVSFCPCPPFAESFSVAASVSMKPGETVTTRIPLGLTSFDKALL
jgi:hypothetical protein